MQRLEGGQSVSKVQTEAMEENLYTAKNEELQYLLKYFEYFFFNF